MTKRTRNFLFILFVFLFLIFTPLAIFYATGYKINLSWPIQLNTALQKTGMFILETRPEDAKIFLNGESQQLFLDKLLLKKGNIITTPAKIQGLLPGEYEVLLEKEGYWPWQKRLTIYPGLSTTWENIQLFKKSLPLQIAELSLKNHKKNVYFSPSGDYIAFLENNKLTIQNTINSKKIIKDLNNYSSPLNSKINWSPNDQRLIYNNIIFYTQENVEPINLEKIIGGGIKNIKWDPNNAEKIYYQYKNSINSFDLNKKIDHRLINVENIKDFLVNENKIILISEKELNTKMQIISMEDNEIKQSIDLPYSPEYKLLNYNNKYTHLYDARHEILYLIDLSASITPLKEIVNNIKYIVWTDDNRLLYANEHEIWLMSLGSDSPFSGKNEKKLLTRISQSITSIAWHPSNNYVLYSTNNSINIVDLSNDEKKNVTELMTLENISYVSFYPNKQIVYFGAKIGNKEGIYKLEI